jgi:hypothetical protein
MEVVKDVNGVKNLQNEKKVNSKVPCLCTAVVAPTYVKKALEPPYAAGHQFT